MEFYKVAFHLFVHWFSYWLIHFLVQTGTFFPTLCTHVSHTMFFIHCHVCLALIVACVLQVRTFAKVSNFMANNGIKSNWLNCEQVLDFIAGQMCGWPCMSLMWLVELVTDWLTGRLNCCLILKLAKLTLIRSYWCCCYCHLTVSSQNVFTKAKWLFC